MASRFRSLIEITNKQPSPPVDSKLDHAIKDETAYVQDDNQDMSPLLAKEPETTFDSRLQVRFITRGNWSFESVETFKANLPERAEDVVPFKNPQPAIGLFDAKTLKRVQKNFPYKMKVGRKNDDED